MKRAGDTRERLLRTASDLIWRTSYRATGVDAICRACGVQKGSFYHHFESKEALTLAAVEGIWSGFKTLMDECFSPSLPPMERFRRFLEAEVKSQTEARRRTGIVCGCPIFQLGSEMGTQDPALRRRIDEVLATMQRYFVTAIRDGQAEGVVPPGDPAVLASMILAITEGAMTLARIRDDLAPILAMQDGVLRLLGVLPRKPARAA